MSDICPRFTPGPWAFTGESGFDKGGKVCQHCGSLHPDIFMQRIEEGTILLGATDKNYKVYTHPAKDTPAPESIKFYFQHLSDEQKARFVGHMNARTLKFRGSGFYRLPFFVRDITEEKK